VRQGLATSFAGLPALRNDRDISLIRKLILFLLMPGMVLAADQKIETLINNGDYEQAFDLLQNKSDSTSDNEEMLYLLGITAPSGKSSSAYLKEYMQKYPKGKHIDLVRRHLADYYAAQGLNITASMIYPDSVNYSSMGSEEKYRVALYREQAGEYKSAIELFTQILTGANNGISNWARLGIADCNLLLGKFELAVDGYKELLGGAVPSSDATPFALLGISEAYARQGKLDRAEQYYGQYKKDYPSAPGSLELETSLAEQKPAADEGGKIPKGIKAGYFIQVGVFAKKDNAKNCLKKFKIEGFQPRMEDYKENGQHYFRVLLGPYVDEAAARRTKSDLEKSEGEQFMIFIE
jgi:tetratricopeptide (TPR) repeat protein